MPHSSVRRTEAKLERHQRRRALKFSLAIAVPLALVMAGALTSLKMTTPGRQATVQSTGPYPAPPQPQTVTVTTVTPPVPSGPSGVPVPRPADEESATQAPTEEQPDLKLDSIATALSRLNLDKDGQVRMDQQAKAVLEAAFLKPKEPMSEARFSELAMLIQGGLQGEAGQQAAAVAERFYRYSNAYREIEDTFGHHGELRNLEANFEQLSRLRRTYLGDELTESLYGQEETLMRYTLKSMRIQADPTLSAEQKQTQQEQLRKQVPTSLIGGKEQASTP